MRSNAFDTSVGGPTRRTLAPSSDKAWVIERATLQGRAAWLGALCHRQISARGLQQANEIRSRHA